MRPLPPQALVPDPAPSKPRSDAAASTSTTAPVHSVSRWPYEVDADGTAVFTSPSSGRQLAVHNVHLSAHPYGPYKALELLDENQVGLTHSPTTL